MAAPQNSSSDSRPVHTASPLQISKDVQGSDNPIPLSPQWLLSKPGDSKSGTGPMENHGISNPSHGSRSETVKTPGDGEDAQKRKDVFRPSMFDSESGRRDRWRDEERDTERDTKSSVRKDRWRDGDKDLGDSRKGDRWGENPAPKNFGEARRVTSDGQRWNDSGNREANTDQRRESKWNTRWGPNDKEPEGLREKWSDSGKDGDLHLDKGLSHGKDEKEDHVRPWRPSYARGRVEPGHSQSTTPNKQASTFSYGRGRGENTPPPVFSPGHGRGGSSLNSTYTGTALDKVESGHEEPYPFRYNRTKLLDVYRVTNMSRHRKLDDFVQVPNLTQDEPLEPLALMTPSSEELSVLNGIDKGEIISSGAPQVTKEGRGSTDFAHTRRMKPGITPLQDRGEDGGSYKVADELTSNRDSSFEGNSSVHPGAARRANPAGDHTSSLLHNSRDVPSDVRPKKSDASSQQPKDPHSEWESKFGFVSDSREVGKWHTSEDPFVKRQLSGVLESELGTRRVPPTAPEDLSLLYKDPKGLIQGPFKGIDIIGWFEAGYFGIDLPVRLENSAVDSPWFSLGDVMPHLRAKARPPPGFSAPQPNELADLTGRQNPTTFGNTITSLNEVEMLKSDSRHRQGSDAGAENRYLESLMSGNRNSPTLNNLALSEGFQGFAGNTSSNLGPSGVDSGNNIYLLAKRMELERQMSLPNSYPYWPGQDVASLAPKSDVSDVSLHSKLLSSVSDNSRQPQSQNSELLSIIQGLSDRTSAGINNGTAGWPNNPLQGGLDLLQNKIDPLHDQNFPQMPFGIQQQRLTPQNQLSLSNLLAPAADNPSSSLTAEKLLSSGLSQDPQIMNLLQQQYLLQLHSQAAASAPQLPLLDKLLLMKQQQKQEEQQLLLRQQQQQLLSKMLQDQQSNQLFGNSSYGQLQSSLPMGNLRVDPSQLQPPQEIFPMSSQTPIPSVHNELSTDSMNLHLNVSQDSSYTVNSKASPMRLPHQLFGDTTPQNNWAPTTLAEQINGSHRKETQAPHVDSSVLHDLNRSKEEPHIVHDSVFDYTAKSLEHVLKHDGVAIPTISMPSVHLQCDAPAVDKSSAEYSEIELPPASHRGSDVKIRSDISHQEQLAGIDSSSAVHVETHEPKKATEKKSKKQKSNKQSSDQTKALPKNTTLQPSKQSEVEVPPNFNELGETNNNEPHETYLQKTRSKVSQIEENAVLETADHHDVSGQAAGVSRNITEKFLADDSKAIGSVSTHNVEVPAGRAWKPAPSVKAKSLLEIQQEEQRSAQTETLVSDVAASVNSVSLATPWAGVASYPDSVKVSTESTFNSQTSQNLKNKKSPLHDLLAEEVLKKSIETYVDLPDSMLPLHDIAVHSESIDDNNFIEAKETKRSRKKSAKSKGSGVKAPVPVASAEVPISSSPIEKGKSSRSAQQEKEVLPSIPAGPSLGDFVVWKGEREQPITSPSPAWSTDSGRVPKPASLRDILKEQGKKTSSAVPAIPVPTPQKSQPSQANWSSASSQSISASSPSKAASPLPINSHASKQSKYKGDDDLFWGPIEQSKQETKQSDFPQLASQGSWGSKNVPLKGNSLGLLTRQKSASGKPTERPISSPASSQSALKLKKDAMTKQSEATGFRDWCENECVRLIGTKDTSFLEFCLKQSRSEAEMLLIENLGSFDPNHQFIDKFLNYKDMLPSDVLDIAFQSRHGKKVNGLGAAVKASVNADIQDVDNTEGSSKASGGKKKGKKGKKVSPLVLGFNVVSNRIMMGEIQTVED